jgi:hypothetical protein
MAKREDIQSLGAGILLQLFEQAASEKAILSYSDAPDEELQSAQRSIDKLTEEISRRMSW